MTTTVRIGEIRIAQTGQSLSSLLGSCVGIVIHDRQNAVAGLAHVQLPDSAGTQTQQHGKYADTAVPEMIRQIRSIVTSRLNRSLREINRDKISASGLIAHLAGGADMFPLPTFLSTKVSPGRDQVKNNNSNAKRTDAHDAKTSRPTIGMLNIQAAEEILKLHKIPVLTRQCGGTLGRRVAFEIDTGLFTVHELSKPSSSGSPAERTLP